MSEDTGISNDDFTDEDEFDSLFGGQPLPALFDKTHDVGTSRTGIITEPPKPKQSRFYAAGGKGDLKYWGDDNKPTSEARDRDGKPRKPVLDEVFVLQTEYRLTKAQLDKRDMDEDPGLRGVFAGGDQLRAIKTAIRKARVKNRAALVGMRLTLTRTGQKQVGDYEGWTWAAELTPTTEAERHKAGVEPANPFADADA